MDISEEPLDEQLEEGIEIKLDTLEEEKNNLDKDHIVPNSWKDHRSEQRFKKWTAEIFAKSI